MIANRSLLVLALVVLLMNLAGCVGRSPKVSFYTLSSMPPTDTAGSAETLALAVGPAEFPRTLNRGQIVTRESPTRLEVDEFHRWGEPLQHAFLRAVGENLGALLATPRVAIYPADAVYPVAFRVTLDVQRFDGSLGQSVTLQTRWTLLSGKTNKAIAVEQFTTSVATKDNSFDSLVEAHSEAVEVLSRTIADRIRITPVP